MTRNLRQGFTTGSAAAAGAKSGLLYLIDRKYLTKVDIPLPVEGRLEVPIDRIEENGSGIRVTVIKDGGDDPDVTNGAEIVVTIRLKQARPEEDPVHILGGEGIGKVTKPGLAVPVGEAAINPYPKQQIKKAVLECMELAGIQGSVWILVEAPEGQKLAQKTMNARLGIVGGISILGTRGTVIPYSLESYQETISSGLRVARYSGLDRVALSTGGRSERMLKDQLPDLSETSFVQVADFFSYSLKEARRQGFKTIYYGCFFGKLIKMAQGYPYTHAKKSRIDFDLLSRWFQALGIPENKLGQVRLANTGRHVLECLAKEPFRDLVITDILKRAISWAQKYAGPDMKINYYLFDYQGYLLANASSAKEIS